MTAKNYISIPFIAPSVDHPSALSVFSIQADTVDSLIFVSSLLRKFHEAP